MLRLETVRGITHRSGVSKKTNKPYDFYQIHTSFEDDHTSGEACATHVIPADQALSLRVGETYEVFTAFNDGKEIFASVRL